MEIRRAAVADIPMIMDIFEKCVSSMEEGGLYLWNSDYPNREIIESDIVSGCVLIIVQDDCIQAYIAINEEEPAEYGAINWASRNKHLVIHRLAAHPGFQGRGYARELVKQAETYALADGRSSIRLDAYCENMSAVSLYESSGYSKKGEVFFEFKEKPFYCYEKILNHLS